MFGTVPGAQAVSAWLIARSGRCGERPRLPWLALVVCLGRSGLSPGPSGLRLSHLVCECECPGEVSRQNTEPSAWTPSSHTLATAAQLMRWLPKKETVGGEEERDLEASVIMERRLPLSLCPYYPHASVSRETEGAGAGSPRNRLCMAPGAQRRGLTPSVG